MILNKEIYDPFIGYGILFGKFQLINYIYNLFLILFWYFILTHKS